MRTTETVMNAITADKGMKRAARNLEAQRLSRLTGRDVDFRATECSCDENPYCGKCAGQGAYHEAFYLSCDHAVCDGPDLECEASGCTERERRRAEAA